MNHWNAGTKVGGKFDLIIIRILESCIWHVLCSIKLKLPDFQASLGNFIHVTCTTWSARSWLPELPRPFQPRIKPWAWLRQGSIISSHQHSFYTVISHILKLKEDPLTISALVWRICPMLPHISLFLQFKLQFFLRFRRKNLILLKLSICKFTFTMMMKICGVPGTSHGRNSYTRSSRLSRTNSCVFSRPYHIARKREDDLFADEKCITLIFITFRAKMIHFHCKSKLSLLAL